MTRTNEQEYRDEAERLSLLPVEDQGEVIALHRSTANNTQAPKRERDLARERADALERHLRQLNRKKQNNP